VNGGVKGSCQEDEQHLLHHLFASQFFQGYAEYVDA